MDAGTQPRIVSESIGKPHLHVLSGGTMFAQEGLFLSQEWQSRSKKDSSAYGNFKV